LQILIVGVGVISVEPLLEDGAEVVDPGNVLLAGNLEAFLDADVAVLLKGQLLQEIFLLEAHLLEEVGVGFVGDED
jgi:hypothetical protein